MGTVSTWADAPAPLSFTRVRVAEASTKVLIASVYLQIGELHYDGSRLVGRYAIRVPLRPSKHEEGRIEFPLSGPLSDYCHMGTLEGMGVSDRPDVPPRKITCEVRPSATQAHTGQLWLRIDTGHRVLSFLTDYTVLP